MFAILLGMQVVQLGIFARAFAAAHLGETDSLVERRERRLRLEHGLVAGGAAARSRRRDAARDLRRAGRIGGFGALSHEYATAIGFTLVASASRWSSARSSSPADDAHDSLARHVDASGRVRTARDPRDLGRHPRQERRRRPGAVPRGIARSRSTRRSRSSSSTRARPTAAPSARARPGARVHEIPPEEFGHGRTRNLGVELARGETIVFTTQDAFAADDDWLARLPRRSRGAGVAGVYGRQLPHEDARRPSASSSTSSTGRTRACSASTAAQSSRSRRRSSRTSTRRYRARSRALPVPRRPDHERGPGVVAARPARGLRARLRAAAAVRHSHAYTSSRVPALLRLRRLGRARVRRRSGATRRPAASRRAYARGELAWLWRRAAALDPVHGRLRVGKFAGLQLGLVTAAAALARRRLF